MQFKIYSRILTILIIAILFYPIGIKSQENAQNDISPVKKKSVSTETLEKYRQQEVFYYDRNQYKSGIPWQMYIARFIDQIITWLFGDKENDFATIVFYGIIFLLIIYFAYSMFKSDKSSPFEMNSNGKIPEMFLNGEEIHLVNTEQLFKEALQNKNYKVALRLSYLKILKTLDDKEIIQLKPEKTNSKYLEEIQKNTLKSQFESIIRIFEYIWYGNFDFDEHRLLRFVDTFEEFNQLVLKEK